MKRSASAFSGALATGLAAPIRRRTDPDRPGLGGFVHHPVRPAFVLVLTLPAAWLTVGLIGLNLPASLDLAWLSILSFMLLGVLVAVDARVSPIIVATLAGAYGALHGLLNGSTLAAMGAGVASLTGIVLTALLLVLLASAVVAPLQAFWARTVVRVAGSWVVAVGMLMLGWLAQSMA